MLYLLLYFLIPTLILCGFLALNIKNKWYTKREMEYNFDGETAVVCIFAFCLWPITLICAACAATFHLIKNYVLPED